MMVVAKTHAHTASQPGVDSAVAIIWESQPGVDSVEFVGRNTAKRRKTTANESVNCDYIFFANISSCHAGLLQGCYMIITFKI